MKTYYYFWCHEPYKRPPGDYMTGIIVLITLDTLPT